ASLAFLIMMFNLPIPGGTTAHAVGGTLLAVLIGPWAACLALTVTLLLQALLFGDGGILAFGANALNMAGMMPCVGYACYRLGQKWHHEKLGLAIGA
ncbi:energy-coupling factor ABC transporter permease, partial [Lactiplantibacillus pentosus]|uniref:energy-coupling factor ABC transporter permease n=1 Tax=Lactiplantibacillus pentosus TaxID=1589 RepID=UPI003C14A891